MRLALALGRANVDEMLRELSTEQLAEWAAFASLEPFGFREEARRTAQLAAVFANFSGNAKRSMSTADFMPREPEQPMSLAEKFKAAFGFKRPRNANRPR